MRIVARHLAAGAALVLAGCASGDTREWMKVNQTYTTAEFRRDHADCSRGGKLDEACMRSRGWVDVSRSKEKGPEPDQRPRPTYGTPTYGSPARR